MAVRISGMFGDGKTYFAGSPVVIDIDGLEWPGNSPFNIARVEVVYDNRVVDSVFDDTGGQTSASFNISSALQAIWSDYDLESNELRKANSHDATPLTRPYRDYSLIVKTEYLDSTDGRFTTTSSPLINGGSCAMGRLTQWERWIVPNREAADVSYRQYENKRYGDASTKPTDTLERVGRNSITSWVDFGSGGLTSIFYPSPADHSAPAVTGEADAKKEHSPLVLRDSIPYIDFLFLNRRGALETCSALMKESMGIDVETKTYSLVEGPSFRPTRSQMAIADGGRQSWQMSSGHVDRAWATWWAKEFLMAKRHWMRYPLGKSDGVFVPVTIKPANTNNVVYDLSKQQQPSVKFTATLALEG